MKLTEQLTTEEVVEDLRALAAERPDYVYRDELGREAGRHWMVGTTIETTSSDLMGAWDQGSDVEATRCHYFYSTGAPACIVGHVMARHGVELADLSERENTQMTAYSLNRTHVLPAEADAATLLSTVQGYQDAGTPWGAAVRQALQDYQRAQDGTLDGDEDYPDDDEDEV